MSPRVLGCVLLFTLWLIGAPLGVPVLATVNPALCRISDASLKPDPRCSLKGDDCFGERWAPGGKGCVCAPSGTCGIIY